MINDSLSEKLFNMDSFLMIGQSNMAGRGNLGEVEAINNKNCHMLRNGRWQKMSEPINPDRPIFSGEFRSGISLAASFADEYAKATQRNIGLIPCADGGTKISQWMPGEVLFDHAVFQAKLAIRSSELKGILWHQGETDSTDIHNIEVYADKFCLMVKEMRRQLSESLPVIIGELSDKITPRWKIPLENVKSMNNVLESITKTLPNTALVLSSGLTLKEDGIHFDSRSCREFGKRYFNVYYENFINQSQKT